MLRSLSAYSVTAMVMIAGMAAAPSATWGQIALPPGAVVAPPAVSIPAVVIYDNTIPFEIFNAGGALLYRGKLQDRVTRSGTGELSFNTRIREVTPGLNGIIARIDRLNFSDDMVAVHYDPTSPGVVNPTTSARSGVPGAVVQWRYVPGIFSNTESRFTMIRTDATDYNRDGLAVITLTTGESVTVTTTQPSTGVATAIITGPSPFTCACSPISITGTANATGGGFLSYTLEYSANPAGPWTNIITSNTPVNAGVLASWNTAAIPSGDYFVKLTSRTTGGDTDEFVTMMRVDSSDPTAVLRGPVNGGIYGGAICFDGTAADNACFDRYTLGYRKQGVVPFTTFVTSNSQVINDPLGTANLGLVADGDYDVRFQVFDSCGRSSTITRTIEVDNTPPVARITSPDNCDSVDGLVPVFGTAADRNISGWSLSVTGGPFNTFETIASGTGNVSNDLLALWDTRELPPCCYTLRLSVTDRSTVNCTSGHRTDFYVSIDVGGYSCPADFNTDGGIDGQDVEAFFEAWSAGECR